MRLSRRLKWWAAVCARGEPLKRLLAIWNMSGDVFTALEQELYVSCIRCCVVPSSCVVVVVCSEQAVGSEQLGSVQCPRVLLASVIIYSPSPCTSQ